jgi:hypothetical protein
MKRLMLICLAAACLVLAPTQCSFGDVINFDYLQRTDALVHDWGPEVDVDGYRFVSVPPPGNLQTFRTLGTLSPFFPGSTALFNGQSNAETILSRADGTPFDLLSIDLAQLSPGGTDGQPVNLGPFDLTFYGQRADGSSVQQTFDVDAFLHLVTYDFSGFNDLVSVDWYEGPGGAMPPGSAQNQWDNISVQSVPAPRTTTMLLGLLFMAVAIPRVHRPLRSWL